MANEFTLSLLAGAVTYQNEISQAFTRKIKSAGLFGVEARAGKTVDWVVDGYGSAAQTYSELADLTTFSIASQITAQLGFAHIYSAKALSGDAMRAAASLSSPRGNADQIGMRLAEAVEDIAEKLGSDLFAGDGTTDNIAGLNLAIHDHNSYAGVNRALAANRPFDGNLIDVGGGGLALKNIIAAISQIEKNHGSRPTVMIGDFDTLNKVHSLFDSKVAYDVAVQGPQGRLTFSGGYDALVVSGVPLIADRQCPAGKLYLLNQDQIKWVVDRPNGAPSPMVEEVRTLPGSDASVLPFDMMIKQLPHSADALKFAVMSVCQLKVKSPMSCGVLTNFTTTIS
jgi:hypothetical protein